MRGETICLPSSNFWRRYRGFKRGTTSLVPTTAQFLAPLSGTQRGTSGRVSSTPSQEIISDAVVGFPSMIGELHTIFYLCFLVLLVYFTVFTFLSLIKNTKNTCCYYVG